jgi:hypothetical protein
MCDRQCHPEQEVEGHDRKLWHLPLHHWCRGLHHRHSDLQVWWRSCVSFHNGKATFDAVAAHPEIRCQSHLPTQPSLSLA